MTDQTNKSFLTIFFIFLFFLCVKNGIMGWSYLWEYLSICVSSFPAISDAVAYDCIYREEGKKYNGGWN
jgi:hypothetical protein